MYLDWQRNPDPTAKARTRKVLFALANNQNFGVTTPMSFIPDLFTAREVAYNLTAKFLAIKAGYVAAQGGLMWGMTEDTLIGQAFLYVDQAIGLLQGGDGGVSDPNHRYVRPFMGQQIDKARSQGSVQDDDLAVLQRLHDVYPCFNPYHDLNSYTDRVLAAKRLGIFTIGGGVPRNWAQQAAPYVEIGNVRMGLNVKPPRFRYGVRVCPEPDYWGGLSGCTYTEGISWGKFVPPAEGGRFAEVLSDATVVWPLLMMGLLERIQAKKGHA